MVDVRHLTATMGTGLLAAAAFALPMTAPAAAPAAPPASHVTGALPDGAAWVADLPAQWNGALLLYGPGDIGRPTGPRLRAGRVIV